jgi:hypothetical protein
MNVGIHCFSVGQKKEELNVARMGEMRNVYNILFRKPEGKRPLRIPKSRWEDNIRRDLREIG